MLELWEILMTENEQRRRDCCLFSIDIHFPKLDVAGSILGSRSFLSNHLHRPNTHAAQMQPISEVTRREYQRYTLAFWKTACLLCVDGTAPTSFLVPANLYQP
jgi:hypothetical protein